MSLVFFRDLVAYQDSPIYLEYEPQWTEAGSP